MICTLMSRMAKILAASAAAVAVASLTTACGTQNVAVPHAQSALFHGATLFNERCAGCHTLSYAATYGSAPNVRTAMAISGPNFNQRCERPIDRVLYAIENGGFSGAYMPQNIVVGRDALDVAQFVATYAGRQAPLQAGVVKCQNRQVGTLPAASGTISAGVSGNTSTVNASTTPSNVTIGPSNTKSKPRKGKSGKTSGKRKK
jgi:cytochrome c551